MRPAVETGSVELLTNAYVERVLTRESGTRAAGVAGVRNGHRFGVEAGTVVISCGAVNSAALLLRSADVDHPRGLAKHDAPCSSD